MRRTWLGRAVGGIASRFRAWSRPVSVCLAVDVGRSKLDVIAENALLRQQLLIARRQFKKPKLRARDRIALVFWSRLTRGWRESMLLVKPETILRWHRQGFKLC